MNKYPSQDAVLEWLAQHPGPHSKRDIATAMGVKGSALVEFKRLLLDMQKSDLLPQKGKSPLNKKKARSVPPVAVFTALAPDTAGDIFLEPLERHPHTAEETGKTPRVLYVPAKDDAPIAGGDQLLVRLSPAQQGQEWEYEARLIRRLGGGHGPLSPTLGIFRQTAEGGRIIPIDKREHKEWSVSSADTANAQEGELVEVQLLKTRKPRGYGLAQARITQRLGDPMAPRSISLIAIHQNGIPDQFPKDVQDEAAAMGAIGSAALERGLRQDLRSLPLITIDPDTARDRDDAVCAQKDEAPDNPGGFILWVAIADVAHYVRPGSALDQEAYRRGNSTYFPDRVVPMLPDILSGDLCSLHEAVDRPCLAAVIRISAQGRKIDAHFVRGLMRSHASLSYEQVQRAIDGQTDAVTAPLMAQGVLPTLYAAYAALNTARAAREPLELDLPERKIALSDIGEVTSVAFKERLDAHKVIEECMILANVAAAEILIAKKSPLLFRAHEEPSPEKLETLRNVAEGSGLTLAKGRVLKTAHLNRLLEQARKTDFADLLNITALRSMTQAYYHPENMGHFGLALKNYTHFTSPIRRYSDLIIHRALIRAYGWAADDTISGNDGLSNEEISQLAEIAKHISDTERRSMSAERETVDRYLAAYLSDRVGTELAGHISGVQRFGVFVKLDDSGADGLIPIRTLGSEFFRYDDETHTLIGSETGIKLHPGQRVLVRLIESSPISGAILLELRELEGAALPRRKLVRRGAGKYKGSGGRGGGRKPPSRSERARPKQ